MRHPTFLATVFALFISPATLAHSSSYTPEHNAAATISAGNILDALLGGSNNAGAGQAINPGLSARMALRKSKSAPQQQQLAPEPPNAGVKQHSKSLTELHSFERHAAGLGLVRSGLFAKHRRKLAPVPEDKELVIMTKKTLAATRKLDKEGSVNSKKIKL